MPSTHITVAAHYWQLTCTASVAAVLLTLGISGWISNFFDFAWKSALSILFNVAIVTFFIAIIKIERASMDTKRNTSVLEKCRRDYTIGCIGMFLLAIASLFSICFREPAIDNIRIYFFSNITSIVAYYAFIHKIQHLCLLEYKKSHVAIVQVVYSIFFFSCLIWKISMDRNDNWSYILVLITYSSSPACFALTLISLGCGYVKLVKKDAEFVTEEIQNTESIDLKCEACLSKYNGKNQTPRILINCGHTLCQGCIERISQNQSQILCPFCQQVTGVHGGNVEKLPKNFAILKLVG